MAAFIVDAALDAALAYITTNTAKLYICTQMPANFTEASSTYDLGYKNSPTFTGPEDGTSGRKVTLNAITDGTVSDSGTASHFALVSADTLLVAQALSAPQSVTSGNTFTLTAAAITFPDAA